MGSPLGSSGLNTSAPGLITGNDGSLPGLVSNTQPTVTAALQAKVQDSPAWTGASGSFFGLILNNFTSALGLVTNEIDSFLASLCNAITGATGGLIDLSGWASTLEGNVTTAQSTATAAQSTATSAMAVANGKPSLTQIPIGSALWNSLGSGEDSTFPRASLSFGSASSSSSGGSSTAAPHTHPLGSIPQYQPAGNGSNTIEIGYIRASRDRTYTNAGFITGGSATFAGISGAYLGIFFVDPTTGNLTLLNTTSAATNIASSITTTNTQQSFAMGYTISAHQGDIFAVALLQVTSVLQTCASLMDTTLTTLGASSSSVIPQANYCYAAGYTAIPSTLAASALNYGASTKLPFYFLS